MNKPFLTSILLFALATAGCGESTDPNAKYPDGVPPVEPGAHAEQPDVDPQDQGTPEPDPAPDRPATQSVEGLVYTVPDGWSVGPARQMRVLTLDVGGGVEIAVAKWPTGVGGLETNLTRWLGQAGYNPADATVVETVRAGFETFPLGDAQAIWMPMLDGDGSNANPMIGVWAPRGENPTPQSETWTFKITGDAGVLREKQDALRAWAESLSFE